MGIYGIMGAGGTGKTSLVETIAKARPDWDFQFEKTRSLVPALGYQSPWQIHDQVGTAFLEAILIASFSPLKDFSGQVLITDLTPLDHYIYYRVLREPTEQKFDEILRRLTDLYLACYAAAFVLPIGVLPFVQDEMRTRNLQAQFDLQMREQIQLRSLLTFEVEQISLEERSGLVIGQIEALERSSHLPT